MEGQDLLRETSLEATVASKKWWESEIRWDYEEENNGRFEGHVGHRKVDFGISRNWWSREKHDSKMTSGFCPRSWGERWCHSPDQDTPEEGRLSESPPGGTFQQELESVD